MLAQRGAQHPMALKAWASSAAPDRSQTTYMLSDDHHSAWLAPSSCQPTSTAATDHYSHVYEASTDSAFSEQEALACTELLCPSESFDPQAGAARAQAATAVGGSSSSSLTLVCRPTLVSEQVQEVQETIRNEMRREAETQPVVYFKRHLFLAKESRVAAVSWAVQVVDQFRIEQETLFLAISYLDRFLSVTQEVVHMEGLHLATLACLSLAAKQTEVTQPSTGEWAWLAQPNSWGTKEHLARMEWIIMEMLEWRGCTPTAWWFLHLFCYGLGICPADAICTSAYLLELSLMDPGCLAFSYSSLAAAALMLSHAPPLPEATPLACTPQPGSKLTSTSCQQRQQAGKWAQQGGACCWGEDQHAPQHANGWPTSSQQQQAGPAPGTTAEATPGEAAAPPPVLTIHMLLELAPDLNLHQVQDACRVLADLHARAMALPPAQQDQALEGLPLARAKYSQELWHHVAMPGTARPLNLQGAMERF